MMIHRKEQKSNIFKSKILITVMAVAVVLLTAATMLFQTDMLKVASFSIDPFTYDEWYAHWYDTVEVDANGGVGSSGSGEYMRGAEVTIYAGTRTNHHFNVWTVVSGGVALENINSESTFFVMGTSSVIIRAMWEECTFGQWQGVSFSCQRRCMICDNQETHITVQGAWRGLDNNEMSTTCEQFCDDIDCDRRLTTHSVQSSWIRWEESGIDCKRIGTCNRAVTGGRCGRDIFQIHRTTPLVWVGSLGNDNHTAHCSGGCNRQLGLTHSQTTYLSPWTVSGTRHIRECTFPTCTVTYSHDIPTGTWTANNDPRCTRTCTMDYAIGNCRLVIETHASVLGYRNDGTALNGFWFNNGGAGNFGFCYRHCLVTGCGTRSGLSVDWGSLWRHGSTNNYWTFVTHPRQVNICTLACTTCRDAGNNVIINALSSRQVHTFSPIGHTVCFTCGRASTAHLSAPLVLFGENDLIDFELEEGSHLGESSEDNE